MLFWMLSACCGFVTSLVLAVIKSGCWKFNLLDYELWIGFLNCVFYSYLSGLLAQAVVRVAKTRIKWNIKWISWVGQLQLKRSGYVLFCGRSLVSIFFPLSSVIYEVFWGRLLVYWWPPGCCSFSGTGKTLERTWRLWWLFWSYERNSQRQDEWCGCLGFDFCYHLCSLFGRPFRNLCWACCAPYLPAITVCVFQ